MDDLKAYPKVPFPPNWAEQPYLLLMRLISPWFYLAHVTTRPLIASPRFPVPKGIELRFPTREELLAACKHPDMMLEEGWILEALGRGDLASAAFDGDKMIGYTWNSYSIAPHVDGIYIEFRAPYRYGYKSFVHPDYRGRRISNAMSAHSDMASLRRGFTHAISVVKTHNFKSIRANRRHSGREFNGIAGYVSLFGRVIPFRSTTVKKLGFRFLSPDELSGSPANAI